MDKLHVNLLYFGVFILNFKWHEKSFVENTKLYQITIAYHMYLWKVQKGIYIANSPRENTVYVHLDCL